MAKETQPSAPVSEFAKYGFHRRLLPLLADFQQPSPIQAACWPLLMADKKAKQSKDLVGIAETGSGKTLAFSLPILHGLVRKLYTKDDMGGGNAASKDGKHGAKTKKHHALSQEDKPRIRALIVTPTRELALQIARVLQPMQTACPGLDIVAAVGGEDRKAQIVRIAQSVTPVKFVVGTPGRLKDLLDCGCLCLRHLLFFVLDEADRMLDAGFEPELRALAESMPKAPVSGDPAPKGARGIQTAMFSATWPPSVQSLAERYLRPGFHVVRLQSASSEALRANERVEQLVDVVRDTRLKDRALLRALEQHGGSGRAIVFVLYKKEAPRVEALLRRTLCGRRVYSLHGDLSQALRNAAVADFSTDARGLLVATDVASRGLDVPDVTLVVNYTFPLTIEDYVHRIGRTARAGCHGVAVTLFSDADKAHAGALAAVLKASGQPVPTALTDAYECVTKRPVHKDFGAFYRPELAGLKPTHITFDDEGDN